MQLEVRENSIVTDMCIWLVLQHTKTLSSATCDPRPLQPRSHKYPRSKSSTIRRGAAAYRMISGARGPFFMGRTDQLARASGAHCLAGSGMTKARR